MFANVGGGEILVLIFAALFILGPERLPGAASWLGSTIRQVREYATGARDQLKDELGPDFDDLRKPLADLQQLRGMSPRSVISKHLLDGGDPGTFLDDLTGLSQDKAANPGRAAAAGPSLVKSTEPTASKAKTFDPSNAPRPLAAGERPPFDPDAT